MSGLLSTRKWSGSIADSDDGGPPKRISTPAGMRLSFVMNDIRNASPVSSQAPTSPRTPATPITPGAAPRLSFGRDLDSAFGIRIVESPLANLPLERSREHQPIQESIESSPAPSHQSRPTTGVASPSPRYATSLYSEKAVLPRGVDRSKENKKDKRGCLGIIQKRILLILGLVILLLLGAIIGLAVGLSKKHPSSKSTSNSSSQPGAGTSGSSTNAAGSTTGTSTASTPSTTVPVPNNFPLGSYSIYTFLDTVLTNCTAIASTWTCAPYVIYNGNHENALATFSYTITGSPGSYKIAPTSGNPLFADINFSPTPLKLYDVGNTTESYRFQIEADKIVNTTLGNSAATCTFASTTFQGYLYTKTASSYPAAGQTVPKGANQDWPFAARFEQVVGGGQNVPACNKAGTTSPITNGLATQDGGNLCSCLYRNYLTPSPHY
ncbi:hypothetical protein BT63DRAFT_101151 [Microthyrium microscopicum]|uniref:Tat pathway signal sequence n=1 Tax=Microthyrium microscopicum TaxID=703497 RepID=A0A6A6TXD2_9PEZI|nr:hypothetical protein BT63DRAFT_101151 [Microthyrium microscopicum]